MIPMMKRFAKSIAGAVQLAVRITHFRAVAIIVAASTTLLTPMITMAASSSDDEKVAYDARLETYSRNMQLDVGGTALTWVFLLLLAALCIAALFKNPNRSHLD